MDNSAAQKADTRPQQRGRDPREATEGTRTPVEAIDAAAKGEKLEGDEVSAALDWFLSDDPAEDGDLTKTIEINVGGGDDSEQRWIPWTIRAVDLDTLRRIRRAAMGSRAQRRAGGDQLDEVQANLRIVVEGTVEPDLTYAAHQKQITDPARALQVRFRHKPGLLGQIAAEIMSLSGYDDEDVREVAAGKR